MWGLIKLNIVVLSNSYIYIIYFIEKWMYFIWVFLYVVMYLVVYKIFIK